MSGVSNSSQTIVLSSNANVDLYTNTRATYINKLPSHLSLPHGLWEVGLEFFHLDNIFSAVPRLLSTPKYAFILTSRRSWKVLGGVPINKTEFLSNVMQVRTLFSKHIGAEHAIMDIHAGPPTSLEMTLVQDTQFWALPNAVIFFRLTKYIITPTKSRTYRGETYFLLSPTIFISNDNLKIKREIPTEIHINLAELRPTISGKGYSSTLATLPYNKEMRRDKTMSHIFERPDFYELSTPSVTKLSVSLTDENNTELNLSVGQPTVLVLLLRPKMEKTFIVRVSSRDSIEDFPENTPSNFRAMLPHTISLSNLWEVALSVMRLPKDIDYTAKLGVDHWLIIGLYAANQLVQHTVVLDDLPPCFTAATLLEAISSKVVTVVDLEGFVFRLDARKGGVKVFSSLYEEPLTHGITISRELAKLFSVDSPNDYSFEIVGRKNEGTLIGTFRDGALLPQTLLVYTNVINPIILGGEYAQIIKVLPRPGAEDYPTLHETKLYESKNLNYISAASSQLYYIDIKLIDTAGDYVKFRKNEDSMTSINLIFRKKPKI